MSKELEHLASYYGRAKIYHKGLSCLSAEEVIRVLSDLNAFESPDFYSIVSGKLVLLEHFEFDASKRTRKGMEGKKEEKALSNRIKNDHRINQWIADQASYSISFNDWQSNFENVFDTHYNKIFTYVNNAQEKTVCTYKNIVIGFIIENMLSPEIEYNGKFDGELEYVKTKQFWDFFSTKKLVDFVLFMGFLNGEPYITYVDHQSNVVQSELYDLTDKNLSLSKINYNDISLYSKWQVELPNN